MKQVINDFLDGAKEVGTVGAAGVLLAAGIAALVWLTVKVWFIMVPIYILVWLWYVGWRKREEDEYRQRRERREQKLEEWHRLDDAWWSEWERQMITNQCYDGPPEPEYPRDE